MMNNNFNNGATNNNSNNGKGDFIMTTGTIGTMKVFAETVKSAMEAYFGEDYKVQVHTVVKNNDLHLTGLTILNRSVNIAPTIYLEYYYEQYKAGATMSDVCHQIIRIYEEHRETLDFDIKSLTDFNRVKDRICYKLVSADRNKELLSDTPHIKSFDLAIIFYIMVSSDAEGMGTITVHDNIMDLWNVSKEKVFELAVQNTQRLFRGKVTSIAEVMIDVLASRLDRECACEFFDLMAGEDDMIPMYVCTNTAKMNGAGVIFYNGLLKEFADRVGTMAAFTKKSLEDEYGLYTSDVRKVFEEHGIMPVGILKEDVTKYQIKELQGLYSIVTACYSVTKKRAYHVFPVGHWASDGRFKAGITVHKVNETRRLPLTIWGHTEEEYEERVLQELMTVYATNVKYHCANNKSIPDLVEKSVDDILRFYQVVESKDVKVKVREYIKKMNLKKNLKKKK